MKQYMRLMIFQAVAFLSFLIVFNVAYAADEYFLSFAFRSESKGVQLQSVRLFPGVAPTHLEQQESDPLLKVIGNDNKVLYQTRLFVSPNGLFSISIPYLLGMSRFEIIGQRNINIISGKIPSEDDLINQLVINPPPDIPIHKLDLSKITSKTTNQQTTPTGKRSFAIYGAIGFGVLVLVVMLIMRRRNKRI